jgi:hypothetical protein
MILATAYALIDGHFGDRGGHRVGRGGVAARPDWDKSESGGRVPHSFGAKLENYSDTIARLWFLASRLAASAGASGCCG